jgi:CubicO group peptidase (beta-lactamase class C family)
MGAGQLRHTSGLTYGNLQDPLSQAYRDANLREQGISSAEFIRRLAALPLMHQPGTHWEYSTRPTSSAGSSRW